ncbi:hypothetical protein Hamer_G015134 [Homarus americanus]|uniref:Uncharacterized protein n=1 Tax=Homarus americanus TaxID=6706 RepID=A0A8J5N770_HOMAM|nr:hypothetical protein Hamer_G015134 [Homarus americanus]
MTSTDAMEEKESLTVPSQFIGKSQGSCIRQLSADSGHSSGDEASCGGGGAGGNGLVGGGGNGGGGCGAVVEGHGRSSHSSESSGKYSTRDSIGSCGGDCDRPHVHQGRIEECVMDLPVFSEEQDGPEDEGDNGVFTDDPCQGNSLHPLHDLTRSRKVSRGSSRGSRGSTSSERGSFSSVTSVTAILKARLGRSTSLIVQRDPSEAEVLSTCSYVPPGTQRPHRAVSLRLPRSHRPPHESDTNLPTIYVDDSPQQSDHRGQRKSSLRRALSLLSMNTSLRHDAASSQKAQKPVQKILRQPRRRHNTVRGLSGLAIDKSNQGTMCGSLQRAHTLYYPTATSLRHSATASRRNKSITT